VTERIRGVIDHEISMMQSSLRDAVTLAKRAVADTEPR
jgi:hypothetical protein